MSSTVEIGALRRDHREGLLGVLESDGTFTADEIAVALELIDDALANGDKDYWVRVAEIAGDQGAQIAGYICYGPTPMTASTFDLYWIVTHQRARGRGVARSLIGEMERDLGERAVTGIRVETSVKDSHDAARRLYNGLGYPEVARFPDFYSVGDDLIVYYKQFAP